MLMGHHGNAKMHILIVSKFFERSSCIERFPKPFLLMVILGTLKYSCIPSFTCMVCKFVQE